MANGALLTVTTSALLYVAHLCARFGRDNEIGGIGFGSYDGDGNPVAMMLLPPGPKAEFSKTSFIDDPEYVNYATDLIKDKYGLTLSCFWHVHPGDFASPSSIDLAQSSRFAKKFGIQTLGYIVLTTHDQHNECRPRFWDRCLTTFSSLRNYPLVTVNSYIFDSDQCQYEPCLVKTIDFDGIQEDVLKCSFIPEIYKLPMCYPDKKIRVIGAMETASSVPAGFTEEFSNIVDMSVPEIFQSDDILTAERVFSNKCKLTLRYKIDNDNYKLTKAMVDNGKTCRDKPEFVCELCYLTWHILRYYICRI